MAMTGLTSPKMRFSLLLKGYSSLKNFCRHIATSPATCHHRSYENQ
jgi:hypothetical protein